MGIEVALRDEELSILQDLVLAEKKKLIKQVKALQDQLKKVTLLDISLQKQWLAKAEGTE